MIPSFKNFDHKNIKIIVQIRVLNVFYVIFKLTIKKNKFSFFLFFLFMILKKVLHLWHE